MIYLTDECGITRDAGWACRSNLQLHVVHFGGPETNHTSAMVREEEAVGRDEPQVTGCYIAESKHTYSKCLRKHRDFAQTI